MLPTKEESKMYDGHLETNDSSMMDSMIVKKSGHLYITTDEEIKEGDWVYWTDPEGLTSDINQVISVDEEMIFLSHPEHSETEALPHECRKIIATTDPKLVKLIAGGGEGNAGVWKMLPQIQQSFIEEYCKAGGIDKVLVEYECLTSTITIVLDFSKVTADEAIKSDGKCIESRLKVDSNNCIIIHPVTKDYYPIYDEATNKTLHVQAPDLKQAEVIASYLNFDNFIDGQQILTNPTIHPVEEKMYSLDKMKANIHAFCIHNVIPEDNETFKSIADEWIKENL